jgi:hypothetical protein
MALHIRTTRRYVTEDENIQKICFSCQQSKPGSSVFHPLTNSPSWILKKLEADKWRKCGNQWFDLLLSRVTSCSAPWFILRPRIVANRVMSLLIVGISTLQRICQ